MNSQPFSFVPFSSSCSYNKINVNEPRKLKKKKKEEKRKMKYKKKESLWGPETAWGRVSFLPDSLQQNLVCIPPFTPSLPEQRYVPWLLPFWHFRNWGNAYYFLKKKFFFFFSLFILLFLKGNFPPSFKCRSLFWVHLCVYVCVRFL